MICLLDSVDGKNKHLLPEPNGGAEVLMLCEMVHMVRFWVKSRDNLEHTMHTLPAVRVAEISGSWHHDPVGDAISLAFVSLAYGKE